MFFLLNFFVKWYKLDCVIYDIDVNIVNSLGVGNEEVSIVII